MSGTRQTVPNSVTDGSDAETADSSSADPSFTVDELSEDELATPEGRTLELIEKRPELALTPIASEGEAVRKECVNTERQAVDVFDQVFGMRPDKDRDFVSSLVPYDGIEHEAVMVAEAMYRFLEHHEQNRGSCIYLEKRDRQGNVYATTEKEQHSSFSPKAKTRRHAQLMGFEREIVEDFEEPATALTGLTVSGATASGSPRPPVDHMREAQDGFSGDGGFRETLRNYMENDGLDAGLGVGSDDWAYIRGSEPHPGDGSNNGYHHIHPAVVVDLARVDADLADLRQVIEKATDAFVDKCENSEAAAHDGELQVKWVDDDPDDSETVTSVGGYLAGYMAADLETPLIEMPLEHLIWATTAWASGTRKFDPDRTARHMIDTDLCRQEAESGDHGPHGERLLLTTDAWGREAVECVFCGSEHDVPETYEKARESGAVIVEPGEADEADTTLSEDEGIDPDCADGESGTTWVGPKTKPDVPEWEAVELRRPDGETFNIGTPGSVERVTVTSARFDHGPLRVHISNFAQELREELLDSDTTASSTTASRPPDTRKAVIDALRDMPAGASALDVSREVPGLTEGEAGDVLQKLKTAGRVVRGAGGYLPAD